MEMTISRRPNRRASRENAPGPRKNRATAMAVANPTADFVASQLDVNPEISGTALIKHANPARMLASGVRYPTSRKAAMTIRATATTVIKDGRSRHSNKYSAPWANRETPRTPRNSNRPAPGLPLGKVENIGCSGGLLGTYIPAHTLKIAPIPRVGVATRHANP